MIKDCNVGVKALLFVGEKCLIVKRVETTHEYWDVPGGRIDDDERLMETLERELREELPTIRNFRVGEIVGAYRFSKNITNDRGLVLLFYKVEAENFEIVLSDEHTEYKWITKENIEELSDSQFSIEPELLALVKKVVGN